MYHPSKGEGEDPCDTIHGVPDRCRGREDMQKPKPGRNTASINTDKLLRSTDRRFSKPTLIRKGLEVIPDNWTQKFEPHGGQISKP